MPGQNQTPQELITMPDFASGSEDELEATKRPKYEYTKEQEADRILDGSDILEDAITPQQSRELMELSGVELPPEAKKELKPVDKPVPQYEYTDPAPLPVPGTAVYERSIDDAIPISELRNRQQNSPKQ